MISKNQKQVEHFAEEYKKLIELDSLSDPKKKEFEELFESVSSEHFPGSIIAYPLENGPTVYYAIAESPFVWRRLRPLLLAFAGPTVTSFTGWPDSLNPDIPVEAYLLSSKWHIVVKITPGDSIRCRSIARKSLARMLQTVINAPTTTHVIPQTTSNLISQFINFLNGNNRQEAERVLEICRSELRVDALNLSFLRIQLFTHFNDWRAIREMPEFTSLCYTRKPTKVTDALLEALYQSDMSLLTGDDWIEKQRKVWHVDVKQYAKPMIKFPIPVTLSSGSLRLYAWDILESSPKRADLEQEILRYKGVIGDLINLFSDSPSTPATENKVKNLPAESLTSLAKDALLNAGTIDTIDAMRNALNQFNLLDEQKQIDLSRSEPFRSILQSMQVETNGNPPPCGWIDWFMKLPDPGFNSAFIMLKRAVSEWPASELIDPTDIEAYTTALSNVDYKVPECERLADAIPLITAWVTEDPQFPRASMSPIYEALLFHLVAGARRGNVVYDTSAVLIRALLSIGLPVKQYESLLDYCLELIGTGAGTRSVYWLLDILEETILYPTPNVDKRQSFWYEAYKRISPLRRHLSPGQSLVLNRISTNLGWHSSSEVIEFRAQETGLEFDVIREYLTGKSIAIYTLTESAARQAESALKFITPDLKVTISSDTGGTSALKSMSQNSDIFIIATSSAKHAATGFIQQMRPREKPTLFASGRGFSSIVRAIEDFILHVDGQHAIH
jgi:hypothetical protein